MPTHREIKKACRTLYGHDADAMVDILYDRRCVSTVAGAAMMASAELKLCRGGSSILKAARTLVRHYRSNARNHPNVRRTGHGGDPHPDQDAARVRQAGRHRAGLGRDIRHD
jgi:hypothetical protein